MRKQNETRARIMDIAQSAVLSKGFGATSIEEIVTAAEITKGGFFYHFPDKNALARALIERYIEDETALFDKIEDQARQLTDDPLQMFLVGLKILAQVFEDMPNGHPGCLIATAAYQERLFDRDVHDINQQAVLNWRQRFRQILDEIEAIYPMRDEVHLDDLADMCSVIVEGGIVSAKVLNEPKAVAKQVRLFRSYIKLLFQQPNQSLA